MFGFEKWRKFCYFQYFQQELVIIPGYIRLQHFSKHFIDWLFDSVVIHSYTSSGLHLKIEKFA